MERDPEYYKLLEENTALQARVAELEAKLEACRDYATARGMKALEKLASE